MNNYENLIDAISGLKKLDYIENFNLKQDCIECRNGEYKVFHNEFIIDSYYRFEGDSNPEDQSIIYAISSDKYNLKGVLINSYGIYSEPVSDEMLSKLQSR